MARHPARRRRTARRPPPGTPADPHPAWRRLRHHPRRQVLLLWRHRFITDTWGWEIPFGKIDPGEDPARAAARETEEETGWRPGSLTPLLRVEPTPGISDSVHHIYLADGAERIGPPEDDFESDHVSWIPLADIPALVSQGEISTGTTLAALLYALTGQQPGN